MAGLLLSSLLEGRAESIRRKLFPIQGMANTAIYASHFMRYIFQREGREQSEMNDE